MGKLLKEFIYTIIFITIGIGSLSYYYKGAAAEVNRLNNFISHMAQTTVKLDSSYESIRIKGSTDTSYYFTYSFLINNVKYKGECKYDNILPNSLVTTIYYDTKNPNNNSRTPYEDLKQAKIEKSSKWRLYVGIGMLILGILNSIKLIRSFKEL